MILGRIDWIPIEELPERYKANTWAGDRTVLVWDGGPVEAWLEDGDWFYAEGPLTAAPTHFAEINAPS